MTGTYIQPLLISVVPNSDLAHFLNECERLLAYQPLILQSIEADQIKHACQKKQQRDVDADATPPGQQMLPDLTIEKNFLVSCPSTVGLGVGRPRMTPFACFFFWMLSVRCNGVKTTRMREILAESKSVDLILSKEGIKKTPGLSTIAENISIISDETRQLILDAQIAMAGADGLDDFQKIQFDSTPVDANTAWPTDSGVICKLGKRLYRRLEQLAVFGLPPFSVPTIETLLGDLTRQDFLINCRSGKKPEVRQELYRQFLDDAENVSHLFTAELQALEPEFDALGLKPSRKEQFTRRYKEVEQDLADLYHAITCALERVEDGRPRPVEERILSTADPDAAFLKKGNRVARIGYRAQLARSEKGLVTAILVPKGNIGDAVLMKDLCDQSFQRTGIIPEKTSGDGGYASIENRQWLLDKGVKYPSFSSSKGARITPEEDWSSEIFRGLRRWRSAVEALMSQLKGMVGFGAAVKRGWKKVAAELTDKVIVFNFMRLRLLRA